MLCAGPQELCKHAAYRPIRDFLDSERAKNSDGEAAHASLHHPQPAELPVELRKLAFNDFVEAMKVRDAMLATPALGENLFCAIQRSAMGTHSGRRARHEVYFLLQHLVSVFCGTTLEAC